MFALRPIYSTFFITLCVLPGVAHAQHHSADTSPDYVIGIGELMRVIQFYNAEAMHCEAETEDGYAIGEGDESCLPHNSDYISQDWAISLSELLRLVQLYNFGGYGCDELSEDGWQSSAAGEGCTEEGEGAGLEVTFVVDPTLTPAFAEIPAADGTGPARQLAAIEDENGTQGIFVQNEIILSTADSDALNAFLARWNAIILSTFDPAPAGLELDPQYLISIDVSLANLAALEDDIALLDPAARGDHRVSSDNGLRTIAAAASEASNGLSTGLNWVGIGDAISSRTTVEAGTGPDGFSSVGSGYSSNAFNWSFLDAGSVQDIGVTEAWFLLDRTGRSSNKVRIATLDMGFANTADLPGAVVAISNVPFTAALGTANLLGCSGGSGCPWHGTSVAGIAFGTVDNSFGAAGVAGPVADPIVVFTLYDFFTSITAVGASLASGARVINMSYSADIPAVVSWSALPFELVTGAASLAAVITASAGNSGINVDEQDCFVVCWEETLHSPCENLGVTCVGGIAQNSKNKAANSNFGGSGVHIYAPYTVLVGSNPSTGPGAHAINGTSFSAPYTAGVAALIWAANPGLSAAQVRNILFTTAHTSPDAAVNRYVHAEAAVRQALGTVVNITSPSSGASIARGTSISFQLFVVEGGRGTPTISWTSSIDGAIGSGATFSKLDLTVGNHTIMATASFTGGFTISDSITLSITNTPPVANITSPEDGATFFQSQPVNLTATVFDANEAPTFTLPNENIVWRRDGIIAGTGNSITIPGGTFSLGSHSITLVADDGIDTDTDEISVNIVTDPLDLPPDSVNITSPANGASFLADQFDTGWYKELTLSGNAHDPEDGTLTGASLVWTTRINGGAPQTLGTGTSPGVKLYAVECFGNSHEITLTATDSASNTTTDTITVNVSQLCK